MKDPYKNEKSLEFRFRLKRFRHVEKIIMSVLREKGRCRILDVGGTETYWKLGKNLIHNREIKIDLLNLTEIKTSQSFFKSLIGDARDMSDIADNSYDLCHSNSVIEHVGNWNDMVNMAREIRRISPNYFVQVPYFWFPIEPHFRFPFFHWLPEQLRYQILLKKNLGFHNRKSNINDAMVAIQSAMLLDRPQLACLFPDANIFSEKIGFLTKSLMAIRTEKSD